MSEGMYLIAVNAGSSSVKLAAFHTDTLDVPVFEATVENIGQPSSHVSVNGVSTPALTESHSDAIELIMQAVTKQIPVDAIIAVGHRIVHGGPNYYTPQIITHDLINELHTLKAFDPEHLPAQIQLINAVIEHLPRAAQVACFDTAFHHDLPTVARLLPLPRRFAAEGVRKYGFHGLSYEYIRTELQRVEGEVARNGRVIIAHLGSGVSLVGLKDGKPVDTTMSMTPASGIPMSTRAGDLDPGLALYFSQTYGYDLNQFNHMVNFESGLLGISETTADMERLLEIEDQDERAKDAVDIFCYQVKKSIGSLAASIGGLDTLVFTGGMGGQAPKIRQRICDGLEFLGVVLDPVQNTQGARLISAHTGKAGVHVIHTNEVLTIARQTLEIIKSK
jgi:acetate kinase